MTADAVAGLVAQSLGRPDGLAGHLVERDHAGSRPARRDDDAIAIDERRLADQPVDVAALEIPQDVPLPDDRRIAGEQAREVAALGEDVEPIAVDGRACRAGRGRDRSSRPGPRFFDQTYLPSAPIDRMHHTAATAERLHEHAAAGRRRRCRIRRRDPSPSTRAAGRSPAIRAEDRLRATHRCDRVRATAANPSPPAPALRTSPTTASASTRVRVIIMSEPGVQPVMPAGTADC